MPSLAARYPSPRFPAADTISGHLPAGLFIVPLPAARLLLRRLV
jgi:hypothetical protein